MHCAVRMALLFSGLAVMSLGLAVIPKVEGAKGWLVKRIGQGMEYVSFRLERPRPVHVHVLVCQKRFSKGFVIEPMLANIGSIGLSPIQLIVQKAQAFTGMRAVAAINGGYFMSGTGAYRMSPIGSFIWRGELVSPPNSRSALICWENGDIEIERLDGRVELLFGGSSIPIVALNQGIVANGVVMFTARFGQPIFCPVGDDVLQAVAKAHDLPLRPNGVLRATVTSVTNSGSVVIPSDGIAIVARGKATRALKGISVGDELQIRTEVRPAKMGIEWALGAGPRLVRDGRVSVEWREENFKQEAIFAEHQRCAVGLSEESIIFVTVVGDGVNGGSGIDVEQLAQLMVRLGCEEAMMLDCGSVASLYVSGELIVPSGNPPRPIANAIVMFNAVTPGEPIRVAIEPSVIHALPNGRVPLKLWLEDEACNRTKIDSAIRFEVDEQLVKVEKGEGLTLKVVGSPNEDVPIKLILRAIEPVRGIMGEALLFIHRAPSRLIVIPRRVFLEPNETIKVQLLAETEDGYELYYDTSDVRAEFSDGLIKFDASTMTLSAGKNVGRTKLTLTLCGAQTQVDVHVGKRWVTIEEFDSLKGISIKCVPADGTVKANCELVSTPAFSNGSALKLSFEFGSGYTTRAAYVVFNRHIGSPLKLRCAVYGDGSRVWLRAQVRDARGRIHYMTLSSAVAWRNEWRLLEVPIPEIATPPLTLHAIYVVATSLSMPRGSILIDCLSGQYLWDGT